MKELLSSSQILEPKIIDSLIEFSRNYFSCNQPPSHIEQLLDGGFLHPLSFNIKNMILISIYPYFQQLLITQWNTPHATSEKRLIKEQLKKHSNKWSSIRKFCPKEIQSKFSSIYLSWVSAKTQSYFVEMYINRYVPFLAVNYSEDIFSHITHEITGITDEVRRFCKSNIHIV